MKPCRACTVLLAVLLLGGVMTTADDCGCGGVSDGPDTPDQGSDTPGGGDSGGNTPGGAGPDTGGTDSSSASASGASGTPAESLLREARSLFQQDRYTESLAAYERTVAADPGSFSAWMGKGSAETALGLHESALSSFAQAARVKPADPDPWVRRGEVLLATGDYAAAAASFDRALLIQPGYAPALDGKARAEGFAENRSSPSPTAEPVPVETATPAGPQSPPTLPPTPAETPAPPREGPLAAAALAVFAAAALARRQGR
ncbi:MAG: tetratricopeptide repeat protein [Methanolinea sp.]